MDIVTGELYYNRMYKYTIRGVVQGVGFRPYISNACNKAGLHGYVQNVGDGVIAVVDNNTTFENILKNAPARIRIDSVDIESVEGIYADFKILPSEGFGYAEIPPDIYLCSACLQDLEDSDNRRHDYFFLTCTACGPRFTIARKSPFDRKTTTMDEFVMCSECQREYGDPKDRRFHAQTIACHACGPKMSVFKNGVEVSVHDDDARFRMVAEALRSGEIVAIKGVGGFHLACSVDAKAIQSLNALTHRSGKPYAVLCRDSEMADTIAYITSKEKELLTSSARPIVLLKKKSDLLPVSELDTIGVMLASTAMHFLLFRYYQKPIVMTSSNLSNEPITTKREQQFTSIIVDHSRKIRNAADDSVIKVVDEVPLYIRRSRGFVPMSLPVRTHCQKTILAMGAEMNNTFGLYDGKGRIVLSQHLGNTANAASFDRYRKTIDRFLGLTKIVPQMIVCDLHPEYNTSLYARELSMRFNIPLISVQHHRAHLWGVASENGLSDFAGIVCDGLGFGEDGTLWGGEVFDANKRIGHLEQHAQLGGDSAARFPLKMLFSIVRKFLSFQEAVKFLEHTYSPEQLSLLEKQRVSGLNSPLTSSCGRILDAAAALLGLCEERTYDGRSAMVLEAHSTEPYDFSPVFDGATLLTTPLFEYLLRNMHRDKRRLAATVQYYLAEGLYALAFQTKKPIVWAGGCAYNRIMTSFLLERGVFLNKNIPAGDGGISFGQICAVLADARNDIS